MENLECKVSYTRLVKIANDFTECIFNGDELLVCLVDNGPFTAAAVAINKTEYDCFMRPDGRSKTWYRAPKQDLIKVGAIPEIAD